MFSLKFLLKINRILISLAVVVFLFLVQLILRELRLVLTERAGKDRLQIQFQLIELSLFILIVQVSRLLTVI